MSNIADVFFGAARLHKWLRLMYWWYTPVCPSVCISVTILTFASKSRKTKMVSVSNFVHVEKNFQMKLGLVPGFGPYLLLLVTCTVVLSAIEYHNRDLYYGVYVSGLYSVLTRGSTISVPLSTRTSSTSSAVLVMSSISHQEATSNSRNSYKVYAEANHVGKSCGKGLWMAWQLLLVYDDKRKVKGNILTSFSSYIAAK